MSPRNVYLLLVFVSGILLILNSCHKNNSNFSTTNWKKEIIEKRQNKDIEFKNSPTSPFAGLVRLTASNDRENYLVYDEENYHIATNKLKGALLSIHWKQDQWLITSFDPEFKGLPSNETVNSESYPSNRTVCTYKKYTVLLYPLDDKFVIIVFDPEKKELQEFQHLKYYPPEPDYRVFAEFQRFKNFQQVKMTTSQNQIKTFYRYAKMVFTLKDKKKFLIAYKTDLNQRPGEALLFIPFTDKTNGITTYPAGRFMEITEPVEDTFILDFNKVFNPLCNYSHVYNCPYPPAENALDIPIEAGEKKYPVSH